MAERRGQGCCSWCGRQEEKCPWPVQGLGQCRQLSTRRFGRAVCPSQQLLWLDSRRPASSSTGLPSSSTAHPTTSGVIGSAPRVVMLGSCPPPTTVCSRSVQIWGCASSSEAGEGQPRSAC